MKNIENSDAERLTKTRMLLTPFFIGFFWKKKYLYTVIDYNDGLDDQSIVMDIHRGIEKVQAILYAKMILAEGAESNKTGLVLRSIYADHSCNNYSSPSSFS